MSMEVIKYRFQQHGDERGQLVALEEMRDIPFEIKRVYYMYDTVDGVRRGYHAHRCLEQLLIVPEFEGTLNGNNHVIKNWTSTHGLFRKMNGAVKDLTIDASCSFSGSEYLAPIALSGSGSISNVHNKAKVSYTADKFSSSVAVA